MQPNYVPNKISLRPQSFWKNSKSSKVPILWLIWYVPTRIWKIMNYLLITILWRKSTCNWLLRSVKMIQILQKKLGKFKNVLVIKKLMNLLIIYSYLRIQLMKFWTLEKEVKTKNLRFGNWLKLWVAVWIQTDFNQLKQSCERIS